MILLKLFYELANTPPKQISAAADIPQRKSRTHTFDRMLQLCREEKNVVCGIEFSFYTQIRIKCVQKRAHLKERERERDKKAIQNSNNSDIVKSIENIYKFLYIKCFVAGFFLYI